MCKFEPATWLDILLVVPSLFWSILLMRISLTADGSADYMHCKPHRLPKVTLHCLRGRTNR